MHSSWSRGDGRVRRLDAAAALRKRARRVVDRVVEDEGHRAAHHLRREGHIALRQPRLERAVASLRGGLGTMADDKVVAEVVLSIEMIEQLVTQPATPDAVRTTPRHPRQMDLLEAGELRVWQTELVPRHCFRRLQ